MATTKRTQAEAQEYIDESVTYWIANGEEQKIISLAGMAEKWRSKTTGPIKRMNELKKNIKALELVTARNEKLGIVDTTGALGMALAETKEEYDNLVAEHGEPKTKKKNIRPNKEE